MDWVAGFHPPTVASNSTVSENYTMGLNARGGGIHAPGDITLTNSYVRENSTLGEDSDGGGLFSNGNVTLTSSTVSGNSASGMSGGISAGGTITVSNSTISNNTASFGGGVVSETGDIVLTNSTVSGNRSSGFAGGIHADNGNVMLTNSTVSGNTGVTGAGGIFAYSLTLNNVRSVAIVLKIHLPMGAELARIPMAVSPSPTARFPAITRVVPAVGSLLRTVMSRSPTVPDLATRQVAPVEASKFLKPLWPRL
ncbi:MAG: right-handed parallel beta-helix repeat-containing protein [Pirellulales bacterium]